MTSSEADPVPSDRPEVSAFDAPVHRLPLAAGDVGVDASTESSEAAERVIVELVGAFYESIRDDEHLGPIFAARVKDWPTHLERMSGFWSSIVLHTGRYAGRPLEVHASIQGLEVEHFQRWLRLWSESVARHVPRAAQRQFLMPAARMARRFADECVSRE